MSVSELERAGWHTPVPADHPAAALLSAAAVRERCAVVMRHVEAGGSSRLRWRPERLEAAASFVVDTLRSDYPDLNVPVHSRWRHFEAGGSDRWGHLVARNGLEADSLERARAAVDLVIPSVLLDAGAGPDWRFRDADGTVFARSEGLALASLALFADGALSSDADRPLRSDAAALRRVETATLAKVFQIDGGNSLIGLAERAALLRRLGEVSEATPAVFGRPARLGNLVDYLREQTADEGKVRAEFLLATLLVALGPVWPGRLALAGVPLGDCWRHPALSDGLLPFHKLTQWLIYSLLEPLADAGIEVTGVEALTGLPEYRNGGLLLDFGVIEPRDPAFGAVAWTVDALPIVEWRALTVVGLDRLADAIRARLGLSPAAFPLPRVLQGGTWSAGRRVAAQRRPGGVPPVQVTSDGTVF